MDRRPPGTVQGRAHVTRRKKRWKPVPTPAEELATLWLVPVEVFGAGDCGHDCPACETHEGYGLCDAVSSWSDCNRAIGHIYRVDETWAHREPGERVQIMVRKADLPFFAKNWETDTTRQAREHVRTVLAPDALEWRHLDGTVCVAGWNAGTGECAEGGGPVTPRMVGEQQ